MKATADVNHLNSSASAAATCHTRRRAGKPAAADKFANQDSESVLERMFLAEMVARRERLQKWLGLIESEVRRENLYAQRGFEPRPS